MMNDIPLDLYRVFYYVAQEGGFSRAALRLHISQSAVSQSVKKLERQLGQRLLTRSSRRIGLTAEGQRLLPRIREAVLALEGIGRQYENPEYAGTIRLGAGDTVFRYYLVDILKQFHAAYPAIRFQVVNRTSEPLMRMVREGALDLAIVSHPHDAPGNRALRPFAEMTYVFAASAELFDRYSLRDFPEALKDLPVLLPEKGTAARRVLDTHCARQGITLKPEIELESVDLLADLARAGLGAAYVPELCVRPYMKTGELRPLPGIRLTHSLMLYLPEEALIPPCARLFARSVVRG